MPREGEPARADMAEVVGQQDPSAMPRLVDRLHRLAEGGDEITFDRLVRCIGAQGHAPLMMVAATLMILPTGLIPGVGGVLGTLVAIVGVQMLIGRQRVWLPGILGRRTLPADRVRALAGRIRPPAEWLRRHLHVRWEPVAEGRISLAAVALFLIVSGGSMVILGAIPVAVPILGLPVAVYALGILARDGVVVAAGHLLVVAAVAGLWLLSGQVAG